MNLEGFIERVLIFNAILLISMHTLLLSSVRNVTTVFFTYFTHSFAVMIFLASSFKTVLTNLYILIEQQSHS